MSKTFDEICAMVTVQIFPGRRIKVFGDASDPEWATALKNEVESALEIALDSDYIGGRYVDKGGRLTDDPAEVYGEIDWPGGPIPVTIELPKD
jgi:hypothetical protein